MKIHDISINIHNEMVVWPGDPAVKLERIEKIEEGAEANVTQIGMSAHCGTHVDAPFHFLEKGDAVDSLSLDNLIGTAQVVEVDENIHEIDAEIVQKLIRADHPGRILFKTRNSRFWQESPHVFQENFTAITEDGADALVELGVNLVGIDYLSIAPYSSGRETHIKLLEAGTIILEGLNLHHIEPGFYELICLPVKITGADGAPARAVLTRQDM